MTRAKNGYELCLLCSMLRAKEVLKGKRKISLIEFREKFTLTPELKNKGCRSVVTSCIYKKEFFDLFSDFILGEGESLYGSEFKKLGYRKDGEYLIK